MIKNLRLLAAEVVDQVLNGQSLSAALKNHPIKNGRDSAWVQAVSFGVCRLYPRLAFILNQLLKKPFKPKDRMIYALLLVGLYQLMAMRVADYASVSETVNAEKKLWARQLINAVLREYLRNRETFDQQIASNVEARYAHPLWWIKKIKSDWPEAFEAILAANNSEGLFALRVNQRLIGRKEYIEKLQSLKVVANEIPETDSGIILESALPVNELPGFFAGEVSVQDGGAQLAARLLDLQPHQRVLDAAAAPGGKLTHILEIEPQLDQVVAVEKDEERMKLVNDNLKRLNLHAKCFSQDVGETEVWWDGQLFDRILLDAPCSGSGVVRRHPDIKLLRRLSDMPIFAKEQTRLLSAIWPTLKPGGLLLYATCSIFPEENIAVIKNFLTNHSDAHENKIEAPWGIPCEFGRQILPGTHQMDGFYYARLAKS